MTQAQAVNMEQVKATFEEYGYGMTTKFKEAIYIFPNGEMVNGEFDCGTRGNDHRMIECIMDGMDRYTPGFWDAVHERYGVVRLVPEYNSGLVKVGQELTKEQRRMIRAYRYTIEEY